MVDPLNSEQPDVFYVGYLRVPRALRRFLRWIVPLLAGVVVVASVVVARSQGDPGNAAWEAGRTREFVGTLLAKPYPMLYADDRGDGLPGSLLLVETGKHGSQARIGTLDGTRARVFGDLLRRDTRVLLELSSDSSALEPRVGDIASPIPPMPRSLGRVTLRGEIVDSKCFLGAMKPGEGKTHKECATLCIRGGIPPVFVTRERDGAISYYLLLNSVGGPIDERVLAFVADHVEVTGESEEQGDLKRLRLDVIDIKRL